MTPGPGDPEVAYAKHGGLRRHRLRQPPSARTRLYCRSYNVMRASYVRARELGDESRQHYVCMTSFIISNNRRACLCVSKRKKNEHRVHARTSSGTQYALYKYYATSFSLHARSVYDILCAYIYICVKYTPVRNIIPRFPIFVPTG